MPQPYLLHLGMQRVMPDVFPPKSHFSEQDIPDQKGKVFLVTGATSGIGQYMSKVLLQKGARVYITARSQEKGDKASSDLASQTGNKEVHALVLELSDPASIKACAKALKEKEQILDVLVNNGGVMHPDAGSQSKDGYEMQFSANVLGPWLLTQLLLPLLEKRAASKGEARIVWLSSVACRHAPREGILFDGLKKPTDATGQNTMFGTSQYAQSKLANILLSNEIARRHGSKKILSTSLHPGVIESPLWRNSKGVAGQLNAHVFSIPIPEGALTQLYAATAPELTLEKDNGAFFSCLCRKVKPMHAKGTDEALAEKLWAYCESEMGKHL